MAKVKQKKNLKDTITTICGYAAFAASLVAIVATAGVALPPALIMGAAATGGISVAIIGKLTGKNPDLSPKTEGQVEQLNNPPDKKEVETK